MHTGMKKVVLKCRVLSEYEGVTLELHGFHCTVVSGSEDSNWIAPAGIPLENLTDTPADVEFYRSRVTGGIDLFRRSASGAPEGLYQCAIAANSSTQSVDTVYLGLYLQGNGELFLKM